MKVFLRRPQQIDQIKQYGTYNILKLWKERFGILTNCEAPKQMPTK